MLRNLNGLYQFREDWERVARTSDRILKLSPDSPEALRDRGLAYRELGYLGGAREDLGKYLVKLPNAEDADSVRNTLIDLGGSRALLN